MIRGEFIIFRLYATKNDSEQSSCAGIFAIFELFVRICFSFRFSQNRWRTQRFRRESRAESSCVAGAFKPNKKEKNTRQFLQLNPPPSDKKQIRRIDRVRMYFYSPRTLRSGRWVVRRREKIFWKKKPTNDIDNNRRAIVISVLIVSSERKLARWNTSQRDRITRTRP